MSLFLLFLFSFLEPLLIVGYFFPGTVLLVFFGAMVGYGVYPFWLVFLVSVCGNILGSTLNYFLGYKVGKKGFKKGVLFLKPGFFKRGYDFMHKHKGKFLILGKLIPGIKETITFVAGMLHLDFKRFFIFNVVGAILWSLIYIGIGYIFYNSLNLAFVRLGRTEKFILLFGIIIFLLIGIRRFLYFFGKKIFLLLKQIFYYFVKRLPKRIRKFILSFSLKTIFVLLVLFSVSYLFLAFIGFTSYLYHLDFVSHLDKAVSNFMFYYYDPVVEKIFLFISYFGNISTVLIFSILFFVLSKDNLWKTRLLIGLVFVFILVVLTKFIVHRPRPELSLIQELSYSFPSFHSGLAMFFYGFLALYFSSKSKNWADKVNYFTYGLFIIILIGLSRLYLNVHYFSDVIGGYWLGFIVLLIVLLLKQSLYFPNLSVNLKRFIGILLLGLLVFNFINYFKSFSYTFVEKQTLHNIQSLTGQFRKYPNLKYTTTLFGRKTEPLNFIFLVNSKQDLVKIFSLAGFYPADKLDLGRLKKLVLAAYDNKTYQTAPMLPIFWNSKTQIFGFQKQEGNLSKRHHIRIWDTGWVWSGYHVYVGCAVFDEGIKWKVTHKISPNIDKEREYFFRKLLKTGLVRKYEKIKFTSPIKNGKNFSYDKFFTDGEAYILWIK